jgi:hypothetical protein
VGSSGIPTNPVRRVGSVRLVTDVLAEDRLGIPRLFCWSKFGTEAGEPIRRIRERKERERSLGRGVFLWGIGNSVGPSIKLLLERDSQPTVLFTPMLSRPAKVDSQPDAVVEWARGEGLDGRPHNVPAHSTVTSRASRSTSHYALVCYSELPIDANESGASFGRDDVVNLASGSPVGSSQVTAVVERATRSPAPPRPYEVAFRATLVYPFVIRLTEAAGSWPARQEPGPMPATLW